MIIEDFGCRDVQKPKIVLGVDELVLPTDGPPDSVSEPNSEPPMG